MKRVSIVTDSNARLPTDLALSTLPSGAAVQPSGAAAVPSGPTLARVRVSRGGRTALAAERWIGWRASGPVGLVAGSYHLSEGLCGRQACRHCPEASGREARKGCAKARGDRIHAFT